MLGKQSSLVESNLRSFVIRLTERFVKSILSNFILTINHYFLKIALKSHLYFIQTKRFVT